MPVFEVDAVVIGGGHHGLVAAAVLADAGWDVLLLEAQPDLGGAVRSTERYPGFVADRFSAFYPLAAVSPALPRSVIVAEDGKFCSHHGIDFGELRAVIRDADDISEMRGGSTLTQQTAKNLFLWQGRSYVRKVLEFPLALWVDLVLGKRRVMEIYLNIAAWG
ncbi:MAG: transglycosylase domain-containing protein, partial [Pseudonocardia sp.]|nr:transglycosylase domain-containing protein [Pseudonocardia sp.]